MDGVFDPRSWIGCLVIIAVLFCVGSVVVGAISTIRSEVICKDISNNLEMAWSNNSDGDVILEVTNRNDFPVEVIFTAKQDSLIFPNLSWGTKVEPGETGTVNITKNDSFSAFGTTFIKEVSRGSKDYGCEENTHRTPNIPSEVQKVYFQSLSE